MGAPGAPGGSQISISLVSGYTTNATRQPARKNCFSFRCIAGIEANRERCLEYVHNSIGLVDIDGRDARVSIRRSGGADHDAPARSDGASGEDTRGDRDLRDRGQSGRLHGCAGICQVLGSRWQATGGPREGRRQGDGRERGLGHKRSLAVREFCLGIEALERFVRGDPLHRVHECVFGVLALESEPVDPRL